MLVVDVVHRRRSQVGLLVASLEVCMVPYGTMKVTSQEWGVYVSYSSGVFVPCF